MAVCFALEIAGMAVGLGLAVPGITTDDLCLVVGVPRPLIIYGYALNLRCKRTEKITLIIDQSIDNHLSVPTLRRYSL